MKRSAAKQVARELTAAGRPDLAVAFGRSQVTAKSNPEVVRELKQMGILPSTENAGDYPAIGQDPTWLSLYSHKTVKAKTAAIAKCLRAGKPKLAQVVSKIPVKRRRKGTTAAQYKMFLMEAPTGKWIFRGTIPTELDQVFKTEDEAHKAAKKLGIEDYKVSSRASAKRAQAASKTPGKARRKKMVTAQRHYWATDAARGLEAWWKAFKHAVKVNWESIAFTMPGGSSSYRFGQLQGTINDQDFSLSVVVEPVGGQKLKMSASIFDGYRSGAKKDFGKVKDASTSSDLAALVNGWLADVFKEDLR